MGMIISSKRENSKVIIEVMLDHSELSNLKGELDDVHIFSERVINTTTNIAKRGKNYSTKYFLIPRNLRNNIDIIEPVSCQRIDTPDRALFIYAVQRTDFAPITKMKKLINQEMPLEITEPQRIRVSNI